MKPYQKYKDSGVEWIGDVPEGWKVKKLKYISIINPTKESDFYKKSDEMVTFLPMENVSESGQICCDSKKPISSLCTGFTYFKKHDVIIAKITPCFENGKGALLNNLDTEIGFGSTEFHVLRANENVSSVFLFYITRSYQFRTLGEAFMTGAAGQKRVPTDFIEDFFISLPSLSEQTTIAAFLDYKTAEIDSLISNKERLIELYEEEKAAVINHAVTKGLDPDAKMKDSGVEWLGEIPEHWEVKQIKYIAELKSGDSITSEKITDNGKYPVYGGNGFRGYCDSYTHEGEYMLIGRQGALCGNINYASGKFWASEHAIVVIFKREYKLIWFGELLRVMNLNQYSVSAAQPGLSVDNIKRLLVPVPSENEQTAIVEHIETKCGHIDAIISKFKRQIELLKEYRTALISEAVTGKIDVRNE